MSRYCDECRLWLVKEEGKWSKGRCRLKIPFWGKADYDYIGPTVPDIRAGSCDAFEPRIPKQAEEEELLELRKEREKLSDVDTYYGSKADRAGKSPADYVLYQLTNIWSEKIHLEEKLKDIQTILGTEKDVGELVHSYVKARLRLGEAMEEVQKWIDGSFGWKNLER